MVASSAAKAHDLLYDADIMQQRVIAPLGSGLGPVAHVHGRQGTGVNRTDQVLVDVFSEERHERCHELVRAFKAFVQRQVG